MLQKKKILFWKGVLLVAGTTLVINLAGCGNFMEKGSRDAGERKEERLGNTFADTPQNADEPIMKRIGSEEKEAEEIIGICGETYAKAKKEDKLDDLEMLRSLVNTLGEKGYTAIDSENQLNMAQHEKLLRFCEAAEAKERGRITVAEVTREGECTIRNMETHDGNVNMIRSYYAFADGELKLSSEDIYRAESWEYTEDGYLMFSGWLAFEGSYEVTRKQLMEYTAYRLLPLDETCRELNRK